MKRLFTLIAAVSIIFVAMAQRPLVTLSHNGELSFFSNLSALQSAIDSAVNGDIIYLSEGKFTTNSSKITLTKRISIVGCGYNSHILADILINMFDRPNSFMDAPLFDGVRLQKLSFSNASGVRGNLGEVSIRNTWIRELENGGYAGTDLSIERCLIETADFSGADKNNTFVQNTKIKNLTQYGAYSIQVSNCNIETTYYCPRVVMSSIIASTSSGNGILQSSGTHVIYNSWLPSATIVKNSSITTYNCYIESPEGGMLDENLEATINLQEKGFLGEDGTVVGIHGGEFPFSENPSVPTVDSSKSSVVYDAENNKLNVTITVSPN